MAKVVTVADVLDMVRKAPEKKDKLRILKQFGTFSVRTILQMNFNSTIKFDLPPGMPPMPSGVGGGDRQLSLEAAMSSVPAFAHTGPCTAEQLKRKELGWFRLLLKLEDRDREILTRAKDKAIDDLGLDGSDIRKLWPNLMPKTDDNFRPSADRSPPPKAYGEDPADQVVEPRPFDEDEIEELVEETIADVPVKPITDTSLPPVLQDAIVKSVKKPALDLDGPKKVRKRKK